MTLTRNSRLIRWAYLFDGSVVPRQTTLCALFWRAFVGVPLAVLAVIGAVGVLLFKIALVVWGDPFFYLSLLLGIGFLIFLISLYVNAEESVFIQGIKSVKSKFCPIIRIDHER